MVSYVLPALLLSLAAITLAIPADYKHVQGVGYYKLHTTYATWVDAWNTCRKEGAHLVVINTQREQNEVHTIYTQYPSIDGLMWIGVHDMFVENAFFTDMGYLLEKAGYVNWLSGEPNNANGGEHCVDMYRDTGKWNDDRCAKTLPFMCEL